MTKTDSVRLLKFVWQYAVTTHDHFMTMDGQTVQVVRIGTRNDTGKGMAFTDAEVIIDGTHYVGSIAINDQATDWIHNMSDRDPAFNNVVLHMVGVADYQPVKFNGDHITTACLKYPKQLADHLEQMKDDGCKQRFQKLKQVELVNFIERMYHERLNDKVQVLNEIMNTVNGSWNELFHVFMFRYIGGPQNKQQFTKLAKMIPLSIINLERKKPKHVEALLLGVSGYLTKPNLTDYEIELRDCFRDLQDKYRNDVINLNSWDKSGRPANCPEGLLRSLCDLIVEPNLTFDNMIACKNIYEVRGLFNVSSGRITRTRVNLLITNFVTPLMFAYGKSINDDDLCDFAVDILNLTPPEINMYTKIVSDKGVKLQTAMDGQAAIQIGREYCSKSRCTECGIGIMELRSVLM